MSEASDPVSNDAKPSMPSGTISRISAKPKMMARPERPQEGRALLALIPRAEGLGGESRRADAQEAEGPEDEAGDGGAEGDAAEVEPGAGTANQGGIDDRRKHRRQVGENGRHGDRQDPAVHRLVPEVGDRDARPIVV